MTTRNEVEQAGHVWMKCGVHNWQALPQTDSGEHYCPNCDTIWTPDGAIHNVPSPPTPGTSQ